MRKFDGKTVMITGCNRGIGKAILDSFAREGANIVACTRSHNVEFDAELLEIEKHNNIWIRQLHFDMSSENEIKKALSIFKSWKCPLDVLINNAGTAIFKGIMQLKVDDIKEVFQSNYFSNVLIIQQLVTCLMKTKGASIINIGSIAGIDGPAGNTAYGASKAALMLMTRTISKELAPLNIRVNCIAPGFIDTRMNSEINQSIVDSNIKATSLKRLGTTDEIAKTALFLASSDSSYINGQIIRVDGGL